MNPLILLAGAVFWYAVLEYAITKLRSNSTMPTRGTFWLGWAQSIGVFFIVVCAAVVYFKNVG